MGKLEHMGFNQPVAAATLGQRRLTTALLKRRFDLSYNGFTLLFVLGPAIEPVPFDDLAAYLILSKKTVFSLLDDLEERSLIRKLCDDRDRRRMLIELSEQGKELVDKALQVLDQAFETVFCRLLPADEFLRFMNSCVMRDTLNAIRGRSMRLAHEPLDRPFYSAEHFVYWRAISDAWGQIVRDICGMPLNAFGILALLDKIGALESSDVARALMLQRSEVSARKAQLVQRGLVLEREVPGDGRRAELVITEEGRQLARKIHHELDVYMRRVDDSHDDAHASVINTWYYRMYTNISAYAALLDEI